VIRLAGAVMLAAGSVFLAAGAIAGLKQRVADLYQLISGLETVLRELDYRLAPLPELLRLAAGQTQGAVARFFSLAADGVDRPERGSFQELWRAAAKESRLCLDKEDLLLLHQLGGVLGSYDGENQCRALQMTLTRLEEQHRVAQERSGRLGRVYGVLCVSAGAFVLILLL